jgi:signal transduction histidine kinase
MLPSRQVRVRLTLGAKIFAGFMVVLTTFATVAAFAVFRLVRVSDRLHASETSVALALRVAEIDQLQEQLWLLLKRTGERTDTWRTARLAKLGEARKIAERAGRSDLVARLKAILFDANEDQIYFDAAEGGSEEARAKLTKRESRLLHDIRNLNLDVSDIRQQMAAEVEREGTRMVWGALFLAALVTIVGALVTFGAHLTLRPLSRLGRQVEAIGRGEYKQRFDVRTSDEIGDLARAFNAMAAALEERELQLIRSERLAATGRIAAQITHEIRNPLSSIGLNAELLSDELVGRPDAERLLAAIAREVDRLTDITEQYLRFARLPQPKLEPEDLGEIARSLAEFSREECARQQVRLEIATEATPAMADENQIRQALLNLIRNAREAMPKGGVLRVTTRLEEAAAVVRVSDTGAGIAVEHRARVFDPFFSTKEGGTGLGLALTQQIVAQHGGTVTVECTTGPGTTFAVRLPALDRAPARGEDANEGALRNEPGQTGTRPGAADAQGRLLGCNRPGGGLHQQHQPGRDLHSDPTIARGRDRRAGDPVVPGAAGADLVARGREVGQAGGVRR